MPDAHGSLVLVRFGEQPDGTWWASLPSGRGLCADCLGELFDQIHEALHNSFGSQVAYEMTYVS